MTSLERIRKELTPAHRKKIEARAAQLVAEEMTLQELRRARKITQVSLAKQLGIGQDGISKLEKRSPCASRPGDGSRFVAGLRVPGS